MIWELGLLGLALLCALSIGAYTVITGVPPMPSTPAAVRALLTALPSLPAGAVFELGSGWGTLAFPLARRFPQRRVVAYELSPLPWLASRLWGMVRPSPNLKLIRGDFHDASLRDAALVTCFIVPGGMERLRPKLETELPRGALVASNSFAVPGWLPREVIELGGLWRAKIYVYRIGDPGCGAAGWGDP